MWIVPAAVWLMLWPPPSLSPRWLVRAVVIACLAAWLPLRWLVPAWVPPVAWLTLSLYEMVRLPRERWFRSGSVAFAAVAVMTEWPAWAPFADWWSVSPQVWAAAIAGVAASVASPTPWTRALACAGQVAVSWVTGRSGLDMDSVFIFAAAFELWERFERAWVWGRSRKETGH